MNPRARQFLIHNRDLHLHLAVQVPERKAYHLQEADRLDQLVFSDMYTEFERSFNEAVSGNKQLPVFFFWNKVQFKYDGAYISMRKDTAWKVITHSHIKEMINEHWKKDGHPIVHYNGDPEAFNDPEFAEAFTNLLRLAYSKAEKP